MADYDSVRQLIDRIVAAADPPSEETMSQVRRSLQEKVTSMKNRGRRSRAVFMIALAVLGLGFLLAFVGDSRNADSLTTAGVVLAIVGGITAIVGAIGMVLNQGFGYVWARNDLHDAAIMELSVKLDELSRKLDALGEQKN
jgi:hypothetical protein